MSATCTHARDRRGRRGRGRSGRRRRRLRDAAGSGAAEGALQAGCGVRRSGGRIAACRRRAEGARQARGCRGPRARAARERGARAIRSSSSTTAAALFCAGFVDEATSGVPRGEEGRPRHAVRGASRQHPPPAVLPGRLPAVRVPRPRPAARPGPDRAAATTTSGLPSGSGRAPRGCTRTTPKPRSRPRSGGSTWTTCRRRSRGSARSSSGSRTARRCGSISGCCSPGRGRVSRRCRSSGARSALGPETPLGQRGGWLLAGVAKTGTKRSQR